MWKNIVEPSESDTAIWRIALWMLDNYGYSYTIRICNSCSFFRAKIVKRKHLNITLQVDCLSLILAYSPTCAKPQCIFPCHFQLLTQCTIRTKLLRAF